MKNVKDFDNLRDVADMTTYKECCLSQQFWKINPKTSIGVIDVNNFLCNNVCDFF